MSPSQHRLIQITRSSTYNVATLVFVHELKQTPVLRPEERLRFRSAFPQRQGAPHNKESVANTRYSFRYSITPAANNRAYTRWPYLFPQDGIGMTRPTLSSIGLQRYTCKTLTNHHSL